MGLNPFKDSNLESLQQIIINFLSDKFGFIWDILNAKWYRFQKKAKERLTIMLIPHSEKKIINFHIPIYSLTIIISAILITIVITSIAIINHASTIKDVSKLEMYGSNSKVQIAKYIEEINKLYDTFQNFKLEVTNLYSLTNEKDVGSLWAKGGISNPDPPDSMQEDIDPSPSIEELNIKEIEQELKTTREILIKTKNFLQDKNRRNLIEYTPSLWPTEGYIYSKFGSQTTPYNNGNDFHQGIEIAAFPGAEIRATAQGTVNDISWDSVLGLSITIEHKYGFTTIYSHCERITVQGPQKLANGKIEKKIVSKGDIIGYVGRTGKASRHMCYYQIKIGTEYIDPLPYLNNLSQ